MSVGVFIAGRLKSERLPQKLILPIGNSCLWDIACSKLSRLPNRYNKYVLAEEGELIYIAKQYQDIQIITRESRTAVVDSPLSFIFKDLKVVNDKYLMFLNPCQSFITIDTIIHSIETFIRSGSEYATSVKKLQNWLFKDNGKSISSIDYEVLSTKEIDPIWQAAHCFHIFNREKFFEDGFMLKEGHSIIPVPEAETIDVDTPEDYEFVRWKHEVCV